MNAKSMEEKIREVIKAKPECRTDKRKLVANFLFSEMVDQKVNPNKVTAAEFLRQYSLDNSPISEIESIGRIHRVVVGKMDEEEGKVHDVKKPEQEKVKSDVKSLETITCPSCLTVNHKAKFYCQCGACLR
jgi:hypothetical protein